LADLHVFILFSLDKKLFATLKFSDKNFFERKLALLCFLPFNLIFFESIIFTLAAFFFSEMISWTSFSRRWVNRFWKFQKQMGVNDLIPCITLFDFQPGYRNSGNYRSNLKMSVSGLLWVIWDWFFYLSFSNFLGNIFWGQIL
jgi:hypothetical protein